jgi:hypothetical protein
MSAPNLEVSECSSEDLGPKHALQIVRLLASGRNVQDNRMIQIISPNLILVYIESLWVRRGPFNLLIEEKRYNRGIIEPLH